MHKNFHRLKAMSLIELLICLAIVAILITVGLPTYQQHRLRNHRVAARSELLVLVNLLEKYHLQHKTYQGFDLNKYIKPNNNSYRFTLNIKNNNEYLLTAIPQGAQLKDEQCGSFSIDQIGHRQVSGRGTVKTCWR